MINVKDEKYLKAFGKHLKLLREEKGLSQEALANNSDVSLPQITRIERGVINPTICTIKALAFGLEKEIFELFQFANNKK